MLKPAITVRLILGAGMSALSFVMSPSAFAAAVPAIPHPAIQHNAAMDSAVKRSLQICERTTDNCRTAVNHAWAVLVFPLVEKTDLGAGGAGAKGALVEDGKVAGYYTIAGGSTVPPANIDRTIQIYALEKDAPLLRLTSGEDWNLGAASDVRLITENTGDVPPSANVEAFIINRTGLRADVSLGGLDIWKTGTPRPKHQI